MKINLKSCLTALIMAGATSTSFAQAIVINDQNDLAANSNLAGDPSAYILDGDIFTVDGVFNISGTGSPNFVIDKAAP